MVKNNNYSNRRSRKVGLVGKTTRKIKQFFGLTNSSLTTKQRGEKYSNKYRNGKKDFHANYSTPRNSVLFSINKRRVKKSAPKSIKQDQRRRFISNEKEAINLATVETHRKRKRLRKKDSNNHFKNNYRERDRKRNTGSTRLDARNSRRFDSKKSQSLTEVTYARRKDGIERLMLVRDNALGKKTTGPVPGSLQKGEEYTQIAVLENKLLAEHFITTPSSMSMVGNIYLGKVQNVLPSMEAAFVDIGKGRNGVLYAGELDWDKIDLSEQERKIEKVLNPGDIIVVQVTKDPVGSKGARLTTQISLAGRHIVFMPDNDVTGISRKLPEFERARLKEILDNIQPEHVGIIVRTASAGVSVEELSSDLQRLQAQWSELENKIDSEKSKASGVPIALYEEPDLLIKVIRDLFNEDFTELYIEGDKSWEKIQKYLSTIAPELLDRVKKYDKTLNAGLDIFDRYKVNEQLVKALSRKVWLPSGGTLVIDRTEAMTIIDVNTGKFIGDGGNLEETVTRNNLEAAEEIVRQIRLRDIGGIIIVDFIDMQVESNRDQVLSRLIEMLGADRTRHQVSEVTSLGLIQITRKKLGTGLVEAFSVTCTTCNGRGILISGEQFAEDQPTVEAAEEARRNEDRNQREVNPSAHPMIAAMEKKSSGEEKSTKTNTVAAQRVGKARRRKNKLYEEGTQSEEIGVQENEAASPKVNAKKTEPEKNKTTSANNRKVVLSAGYNVNEQELPTNTRELREAATEIDYQVMGDSRVPEEPIVVNNVPKLVTRRKAVWEQNGEDK